MSVSTSIDLPPAITAVSPAGGGLTQSPAGNETAAVPVPASPKAQAAGTGKTTPPPNVADVTSAAKQIAAFLSGSKTDVGFTLDQSSGRMVVRITDAATGKVIRQIPSEVALQIAQELKQNKTVGSLQFDEKA